MPKLLPFAIAVLILNLSLFTLADESLPPEIACCRFRSNGWSIQETDNFRICTLDQNLKLEKLPAVCEALKAKIQTIWLENASETWQPRCDVIVHATLAEYRRTLGNGVGNSVGCATMRFDAGRIVSRRIDIRVDADNWQHDALPHELTHVVLADRFGTRQLPAWINEGIGVLAESNPKKKIRAGTFREAQKRGTVYTVPNLINLREYPKPQFRDAFYVQSAAIVQLLIERENPQEFMRFADCLLDSGMDQALRQVFDLDGLPALSAVVEKSDVASRLTSSDSKKAKRELVAREE